MNDNFFKTAKIIIEKLEVAGYEAYIVGGAVRDHILRREIHDIDITTNAPTEMIKVIFPHSINVALNHGTVIVVHNDETFEVTSFRGHSLEEDLMHRDFTMNALALTKIGKMIDPSNGLSDLEKSCIRGVGNPSYRFKEDPLRMLRAIRFVSQLGFSIESSTLKAIHKGKHQISKVAIERIAKEFEKLSLGSNCEKAFHLLSETKIIDEIESFHEILEPLKKPNVLSKMPLLTNMAEIWSLLLFSGSCENCKSFLRKWKQSKKLIFEVNAIVESLGELNDIGFTDEALYTLGIELAKKAERVRAVMKNESPNFELISTRYEKLPIKNKSQLAINGKDIISLLSNKEQKERIGELIKEVEKVVLMGVVKNKKELIIDWLREEGHLGAK